MAISDLDRDDQALIVTLLEDSATAKLKRDNKNIAIRDLFEWGFTVREPNGPRQIHSKLLIQAFTQLSTMMKFLDFELRAQNTTDAQRSVTTAGVATVADMGGLDEVMRDKGGSFGNLLLYGDSYFTCNLNDDAKEKTKVPIVFDNYTNSNVVLDNNATKMRGRGGKAVKHAMVYSEFLIADAKDIFGAEEIGDANGKIPRTDSALQELNKTVEQQSEQTQKTIEIAYYWNITKKKYLVIAGSEMKELERKEGKDYPFMKNGKAYIPIFNFICTPSAKGIYNHGIGDYIYELAIVSQRLFNLGIGHGYKNTDPITILNVPQGQSKKFVKKLDEANRMRAQGKEAYLPVEYDKLSPGANAVQSQAIVTQALINEWQMLFDRLTAELKRWGINIDAVERGANVTASQIISEEEARNSFVKQIMEYNASETQFLIEIVLELLEKEVSKNNNTPLNTTIKLEEAEAGEVIVENITLGDVASELKTHDYYVRVNSRTGVIPSNVMKQAGIVRVLSSLPPGTAAHTKLLREFASLNNQNFAIEDFGAPQQAGQGEIVEEATVTGTDREKTNVRSKVPEPVL